MGETPYFLTSGYSMYATTCFSNCLIANSHICSVCHNCPESSLHICPEVVFSSLQGRGKTRNGKQSYIPYPDTPCLDTISGYRPPIIKGPPSEGGFPKKLKKGPTTYNQCIYCTISVPVRLYVHYRLSPQRSPHSPFPSGFLKGRQGQGNLFSLPLGLTVAGECLSLPTVATRFGLAHPF